MCRRYVEYTESEQIRIAVGTYNVNGGKHFRSVVFKDIKLSDWLLDAHVKNQAALLDTGHVDEHRSTPVDIYAIGNLFNTRGEPRRKICKISFQ